MRLLWSESETDDCGAEIVADPLPTELSPGDRWRANQTTGSYQTEREARSDFMSHINTDHWRVEEEVTGQVIQPRLGCDKTRVSADVVLFPKKNIIDAGWNVGPLCVELKRSGVKIGPVVDQTMCYMRCIFEGRCGLLFMPQFCMVFPLARVGESMQSIMVHNRIGHSHVGQDGMLRMYINGAIAYTEDGRVFLGPAQKSGKKFASR